MNDIPRFHSTARIISDHKRKLLTRQHTACEQIAALVRPCFQIIQFLLRYLLDIASRIIRKISKHHGDCFDQFFRTLCDRCRNNKIHSPLFDLRHHRRDACPNASAEVCDLTNSIIIPSLNIISKLNIAVIAKAVCKFTAGLYQFSEYLIQRFLITLLICHLPPVLHL